jgi:Uma2 family endonuclease
MAQPLEEKRLYTVEEYLALDEASDVRHEYYHGEVYAMTGASLRHNRIVRNGCVALQTRLAQTCEVFVDGALVKINEGVYFYPDLVVSCSEEDLQADRVLQHPAVIIEILSPGTADYDRTTKMRLYQQLPSLQHYVIIRQDYCWVECLSRVPGQEGQSEWLYRVYDALTDVLQLSTVGINIPLAELYARVALGEPPQIRPYSNEG